VTPLAIFLLAAGAVFVGTVSAAFSSMMRLSLRLTAERSDRDNLLGWYLDDPMRLFIPARIALAVIYVVAGALLARVIAMQAGHGLPTLIAAMAVFALVCEHLIPLVVIRRDPEGMLGTLLPAFHALQRPLRPVTLALLRLGRPPEGADAPADPADAPEGGTSDTPAENDSPLENGSDQARALLRSIVDFRDTLVREVMTPRPDIVAIEVHQSLEDLRRLFREQQYSRVPVFDGTLDNILGFAFVKDLVLEPDRPNATLRDLLRPAHFVPETKKVPALLAEFQRTRVQSAIVVDEYGGTAGLVTVEDLLEEIVGEIRDEYDVESESVVDEGDGVFVMSGKADVSALQEHFGVAVERAGFDSVGGYLLSSLGRVPVKGEHFDVGPLAVEVLDAERRRVTRVRLRRRPETDEGGANGA
jgi:CBS domain containing-hemolysin-like protein